MSKTHVKPGDIVLAPFPFTDLTSSKIRPVLVVYSERDDVIVVFISSQKTKSIQQVEVEKSRSNGLNSDSLILCNKITTLDKKILLGKIGDLEKVKLKEVSKMLCEILAVR